MKYIFNTSELVCSQAIEIEIENDTIQSVQFRGGCPGNLIGIAKLVKGMKIADAIQSLEGTRCGDKPTSCPDQLASALKLYLQKIKTAN